MDRSDMRRLYRLLSNRDYYSLSLKYAAKELGISRKDLRDIESYGKIFQQRTEGQQGRPTAALYRDTINIFVFSNVEYIGLESRRIDYEHDKLCGCNWVEDAIKNGDYN